MIIKFYDQVDDELLKFAVIFSRYHGKWVYCRHKNRNTYEPVCVYSVEGKTRVNENGEESFGMLYYATIFRFEELSDYEIEEVRFFDDLPEELTYPLIQPVLLKKLKEDNYIQK